MATVNDIFMESLTRYHHMLGLPTDGSLTLPEEISRIGEFFRNHDEFSEVTRTHLNDSLRLIREDPMVAGGTLRDQLANSFAKFVLLGLTTQLQAGSIPLRHHWVPRTYLRRFGCTKARCKVSKTMRVQNTFVTEVASDREFIHPIKNNSGFYDIDLEMLFGRIEERYALAMTDGHEPCLLDLTLFMMAQMIRAPHPETGFEVKTLIDFVEAMLGIIGDFSESFTASIVDNSNPQTPFGFTPYFPTRRHDFADGASAWTMALTGQKLLVLSSVSLPKDRLNYLSDTFIDRLYSMSRNFNQTVYGLMSKSMYRKLQEDPTRNKRQMSIGVLEI